MKEYIDLLNQPRERHYAIGHYAFRQISMDDPHYFFALMGSSGKDQLLNNLIQQAEKNCPEDRTQLLLEDFRVDLSRIENHPMVIIQMPSVKACEEAIYVAVISMIDLSQNIQQQNAEIKYYTLELAVNHEQQISYYFCQWIDDKHINLAEIEGQCSKEEFMVLIEQHINTKK